VELPGLPEKVGGQRPCSPPRFRHLCFRVLPC